MAGIARLDDARLTHFQPEVVAFTGALTHAGEHGVSAVLLGHVVDQFLNYYGLAHTCAAEESDLSAFQEWLDEINDLHAGYKHLRSRGLLVKCRRWTMDGQLHRAGDRTKLIDRLANHVHHAAQRAFAHRNGNRSAQVNGFHAAHHALGRLHGDAAYAAFAQVLLHFQRHVDGVRGFESLAGDQQRLIDRRQLTLGELHVDRGTRDLNHFANVFCSHKTFA